mgnify:CR=1 FL=1
MADPTIRLAGNIKAVDAFPGVVRRTLASGDRLTMVRIDIQVGHVVPKHVHPHEQAGTVIAGRIRIEIDGQQSICDEGDVYLIPGDLEHEVTALEPTTLIEVFSPVREDFVPDL